MLHFDRDDSTAGAPRVAGIRELIITVRRTYATALWAALILALLDGALAALVGDLVVTRLFDLARFALFLTGAYALLGLALATLEIPFVLLLRSSIDGGAKGSRSARGWAAAIAIAGALFPLEPIASRFNAGFARSSFAGLGMALVGVGLSLIALLVFAILERLLGAALGRALRSESGLVRALAAPAPAMVAPLVVIALWGVLVGADFIVPGAREAVSLAATAVAMLAIQGGLMWLLSSGGRAERLAGFGVAGALIAVLAVFSLADAAWRAPRDDAAVEAVSHQTLLGSYVVPALRRGVRGADQGPVFLPPGIGRRPVRALQVKQPRTRRATTASRAARRTSAAPRPAALVNPTGAAHGLNGTSPASRSAALVPAKAGDGGTPSAKATERANANTAAQGGSKRNLLLITFDRFQSQVMALPQAEGLQELAARSYQARLLLLADTSQALRALLSDQKPPLGRWLRQKGYRTLGFQAASARGRHRPAGFDSVEVVRRSRGRNAADTTIRRAISVARGDRTRRWFVWVHLPGPRSRSAVARRAAARRAGLRVSWLVRGLERGGVDERTVVVVIGFSGRTGTKATALLATPGGVGARGDDPSLSGFLARVRQAVGSAR